jgi:hypothetical protein
MKQSALVILVLTLLAAAFQLGRIDARRSRYEIAPFSLGPDVRFPVRVDKEAGTMESLRALGPLHDVLSKTR